jgi:hypothetical protein
MERLMLVGAERAASALYVIILLNYLSYCKSAFGDRKLFQENYFFTKGIYRDF